MLSVWCGEVSRTVSRTATYERVNYVLCDFKGWRSLGHQWANSVCRLLWSSSRLPWAPCHFLFFCPLTDWAGALWRSCGCGTGRCAMAPVSLCRQHDSVCSPTESQKVLVRRMRPPLSLQNFKEAEQWQLAWNWGAKEMLIWAGGSSPQNPSWVKDLPHLESEKGKKIPAQPGDTEKGGTDYLFRTWAREG